MIKLVRRLSVRGNMSLTTFDPMPSISFVNFPPAMLCKCHLCTRPDLKELEQRAKNVLENIDMMMQDPEDIQTEVELVDENGNLLGAKTLADAKTLATKRSMELIPEDIDINVKKNEDETQNHVLKYKLATESQYQKYKADLKIRKLSDKERTLKLKWVADPADIELKSRMIRKWLAKGQRVKIMWVAPTKTTASGFQQLLTQNQNHLSKCLSDLEIVSVDNREIPLNFVVQKPKKSKKNT